MSWLSVIGVVAALFLLPSSTGATAARAGSLTVTPGTGQYGGASVHWVATGLPANAKAHLQRKGTLNAAWADVENSYGIGSTNASGRIEFDFPTPAMNSVYFRVVAGGAGTEHHLFLTKQQEARLSVVEHDPMPGAPLKNETPSVGRAVVGEPFSISADTAFLSETDPQRRKPVLVGRDATLERRTISGGVVSWDAVDTDTIGRDGKLTFSAFGSGRLEQTGAYRVRLEDWTVGLDDIGRYLSFPFEVRVVERPEAVRNLKAIDPEAYQVNLTWAVPLGGADKIVITRAIGRAPDLSDDIATVGGAVTSYGDGSVVPQTTYRYALYSLRDGIYSRIPATVHATTPAPPAPRGEG